MQKLLDSWKSRKLTLLGKTLVVKSLAISKLVFSALNTAIPDNIDTEINKILYRFIWNKTERIKRNTIIAPLEHGGLGMVDIASFFTALKATWVEKILKDNANGIWNCSSNMYLNQFGRNNILLEMNFTKTNEFPEIMKLPTFYQQVLLAYNKCKILNCPNDNSSLMKQIIWGNRYLQIYNKNAKCQQYLYNENWIDSDFIYIENLPLHNGMIDLEKIKNKLKSKSNYLVEAKLIQQALKQFRNILLEQPTQISDEEENTELSYTAKPAESRSKINYEILLSRKYVIGKFKQLECTTDKNLQRTILESACKYKILDVKENRLREFNYKLFT